MSCIDVHHHFGPPAYVAGIGAANLPGPIAQWTPERSLAEMDRGGVATALLSLTNPGLWFGEGEQTRRLARACNEHAAELIRAHPGRFGAFAALPLPDVDAALAEVAYALDELGLDGVYVFTSYETTDIHYLGDARFRPLWEELDRRGALVATHPRAIACCRGLIPEIADSAIEFGTDTTRTVASLVFNGVTVRFRKVRIILSHAGGTMPYLVERFIDETRTRPQLAALFPNGVEAELQRFFFDTAQAANPHPLAALRRLVSADRILFGTDFPYRETRDQLAGLRASGFSDDEMRRIERENALRLTARRSAP